MSQCVGRSVPYLALLLAAAAAGGCHDGTTAPAAAVDGEWYGELASVNVALSVRGAGGQVSGAGWVGHRSPNDPAYASQPFGSPEPVMASGSLDPQSGAVHLTLTTRAARTAFGTSAPYAAYTLEGVVRGAELAVGALVRAADPGHPEAGSLARSDDARGTATVTARVTDADPAALSGDYAGAAYSSGSGVPTYPVYHVGYGDVLDLLFAAGRPGVGRYVLGPDSLGHPTTAVAAFLFSSTGGGRTSSYFQAFEPDGAGAGEVQVTTSTPYRVAGTYQFTAVLLRNGQRQPDHLVVAGAFDVPCLGACQ